MRSTTVPLCISRRRGHPRTSSPRRRNPSRPRSSTSLIHSSWYLVWRWLGLSVIGLSRCVFSFGMASPRPKGKGGNRGDEEEKRTRYR